MTFNMIVAMCRENNGIGLNNRLPWFLKDDLKRFSALTKGDGHNAIIMGRKTFESLPRMLPGRVHLVLSRTEYWAPEQTAAGTENVFFFTNIAQLVEFSQKFKSLWVIGGADIYQQFLQLNLIKRCYVTWIDKYFPYDTCLSLPDISKWQQIESVLNFDPTYQCNIEYALYSVAT